MHGRTQACSQVPLLVQQQATPDPPVMREHKPPKAASHAYAAHDKPTRERDGGPLSSRLPTIARPSVCRLRFLCDTHRKLQRPS